MTYRVQVSGIFSAGDGQLDKGLAFMSFDDAGEVFGFEGYAPNIGVRLKNYNDTSGAASKIRELTHYTVSTWKIANINTLSALNNEKQVIRILLVVFFAVAFFGILAVMTALVSDKRDEIALLKTLGLSPAGNTISFLWTGILLGLSASAAGIALGLFLSVNFNLIIKMLESVINAVIRLGGGDYTFTVLNQNVYYLKEFPILTGWRDIAFSALSACFCTISAAIYPAVLSTRFKAAEILRKRAF